MKEVKVCLVSEIISIHALTFVEGHKRNVTSLFGMNLSRNSLTVSCFGET
jgi:hypothetical protein